MHIATSSPDEVDNENERLLIPLYVSDDKEEDEDDVAHNHWVRRSKRVQQNLRSHERDKLRRSVNLVEHDTTNIPDLTINVQRKLARGLGQAN